MENQRINEQIHSPFVIVIRPDGSNAGRMDRSQAIFFARECGLDLVMVTPSINDSPPICKVMDYGKLKFEKSKRDKQQHHGDDMKEVYIGFKTAIHDLDTKMRKVNEFLVKHKRVKFAIELVGREKSQLNEATERFEKLLTGFVDKANWAKPSVSMGKKFTVSTILSPK